MAPTSICTGLITTVILAVLANGKFLVDPNGGKVRAKYMKVGSCMRSSLAIDRCSICTCLDHGRGWYCVVSGNKLCEGDWFLNLANWPDVITEENGGPGTGGGDGNGPSGINENGIWKTGGDGGNSPVDSDVSGTKGTKANGNGTNGSGGSGTGGGVGNGSVGSGVSGNNGSNENGTDGSEGPGTGGSGGNDIVGSGVPGNKSSNGNGTDGSGGPGTGGSGSNGSVGSGVPGNNGSNGNGTDGSGGPGTDGGGGNGTVGSGVPGNNGSNGNGTDGSGGPGTGGGGSNGTVGSGVPDNNGSNGNGTDESGGSGTSGGGGNGTVGSGVPDNNGSNGNGSDASGGPGTGGGGSNGTVGSGVPGTNGSNGNGTDGNGRPGTGGGGGNGTVGSGVPDTSGINGNGTDKSGVSNTSVDDIEGIKKDLNVTKAPGYSSGEEVSDGGNGNGTNGSDKLGASESATKVDKDQKENKETDDESVGSGYTGSKGTGLGGNVGSGTTGNAGSGNDGSNENVASGSNSEVADVTPNTFTGTAEFTVVVPPLPSTHELESESDEEESTKTMDKLPSEEDLKKKKRYEILNDKNLHQHINQRQSKRRLLGSKQSILVEPAGETVVKESNEQRRDMNRTRNTTTSPKRKVIKKESKVIWFEFVEGADVTRNTSHLLDKELKKNKSGQIMDQFPSEPELKKNKRYEILDDKNPNQHINQRQSKPRLLRSKQSVRFRSAGETVVKKSNERRRDMNRTGNTTTSPKRKVVKKFLVYPFAKFKTFGKTFAVMFICQYLHQLVKLLDEASRAQPGTRKSLVRLDMSPINI